MSEAILIAKNITKAFGENMVLHGIDMELYAEDFGLNRTITNDSGGK